MYQIGYNVDVNEVNRYRCAFEQVITSIDVLCGGEQEDIRFDKKIVVESVEELKSTILSLLLLYPVESYSTTTRLFARLKSLGVVNYVS